MTQQELIAENERLRKLQEQQVTALKAVWKCYTATQIGHARVGSAVWLVAEALDEAGVRRQPEGDAAEASHRHH
ncbi:hypothetical protein [Cupriavidus basilensis]|jgi:type VI protein secretion system component VasF|uniref:hypothetical protein n=1 Tax=Cupriavidus basilensis TaxID=68895 RepID=UPI0020A68846|nr:hypothetical protein [Cupriavidus basilensis]MCP3023802.1 hypothetical protein [Cupriavidus basilensis]